MTYRNRPLLDLAHEAPCFAKFPHDCNAHMGCVPAHSNWLLFGRGSSHKTPDWAYASVCSNAHRDIDPGLAPRFDREQRQTEWTIAYIGTQNWLWENEKVRVA